MDNSPPATPPPPPARDEVGPTGGRRFRPLFFLTWLFLPALLTLGQFFVVPKSDSFGVAVVIAIFGSLIGGIICGIHFARSMVHLSPGAKVGVGIAMVIGCAGVAFAISFGGCFLGAGISEAKFLH